MARVLRIKYKNALYHITSRGNERRNIFGNDHDRNFFIKTLKESLNRYHVILYSYILMSNHFYLLLETPLVNISEFMRQFNIIYTSYYNRKYKRVGHLFQGRYKSILVQKDDYLHILSRYIHLNPVRVVKIENVRLKEKEKHLVKKEKEMHSVRKIHSYCTKDKVIEIACREIGKTWEQIKSTPNSHRQILMKMLYHYTDLNNREIGELMALDYSTVSVGRRRLRAKLFNDSELRDLVGRIEEGCQE